MDRTVPVLLFSAALVTLVASASPVSADNPPNGELFRDEFESGTVRWEISNPSAVTIIDSGDPAHGKVLQLAPADSRLQALMRGSETWGRYRVEGEVLFPTDDHNYLGWIYNYNKDEQRTDLGSLYIKGNGSYIRVNPRRDWNPGRQLYEELRVDLEGDDAIEIGEWKRFAAEVVGRACHFYVGDMTTPKVTFDFFEFDSGKAGFKPRVVGGPVWIDNIRVTPIAAPSYRGPHRPAGVEYAPERLITRWEVLGPLTRAFPEVEATVKPSDTTIRDGKNRQRWRKFNTDPRGAVVTARATDFVGPRTVAYFRTTVEVADGENAVLEFSTLDDMAMWNNGVFEGYTNERGRFPNPGFGDRKGPLPSGRRRTKRLVPVPETRIWKTSCQSLSSGMMSERLIFEVHEGLPREGVGRDVYTRRAYEMLPQLDAPRILDIGCGSGAPTLELARSSGGQVTGLDVHQPFLDELARRAVSAGLADRVNVVQGSMLSMEFPDESFDLLWSEGSIFVVGFDKGLEQWRRLIRPGGYLVVHDVAWLRLGPPTELRRFWSEAYPAIRSIPDNLTAIPPLGYDVLGHFPLPEDAWWVEYYRPLEKRVHELRTRYADDDEALTFLDDTEREIDMLRKYPGWYGSVFFVMRRI